MPEQLTKHPEVTLQVLRSAGARCGEGVAPQILVRCPPARFCQLPGGEVCVHGLGEAAQMTQVSAAEWRQIGAAAGAGGDAAGAAAAIVLPAVALVAGVLLGLAGSRWRRRAPRP